MRTGGDERQRSIEREATRLSAYAMGTFALAGTLVQVARGEDPAGFAWILTAGGISYGIALGILGRQG
jgi:hypothetical protein